MATGTSDELRKVGAAEELELASVRNDGTVGNPVTIWVVRVGDNLYVRSWKGRGSSWFRASQVRHAGHIKAGGVGKDVAFVAEADDNVNDQIDAGYRKRSTPGTGRSTGSTTHATSIPWWPLRRAPRRSSWSRGQQLRSRTIKSNSSGELVRTRKH
jgi:hypothetical protein